METITVKINQDGVTAREVNPLGKEPNCYFTDPDIRFINQLNLKAWREAESRLRTFEIDPILYIQNPAFINQFTRNAKGEEIPLIEHALRQAQIIESGKIRIV